MTIEIRDCIKALQPYPPGKPIEEVEREYGVTEAVKLASNENPLGPSPKAIKALKNNLNSLNRYPDGNAYYLKKAISEKFKISEERIVLGNGSDEIVMLLALAFINPGEEIIVSQYSFVRYKMGAQLMGARCIEVPLVDYQHSLGDFPHCVTSKTKAIFIDNPMNPIGTMATRKKMEKLLEKIADRILIVVDEAYFEYVKDKKYPNCLEYIDQYPNLVVLRTFSKIYGLAGLRIGYGFSSPEIINGIECVRPPFNVNSAAQIAGLAALSDNKFVKKSAKYNQKQKKFLYKELDNLKIKYIESHTNFILINLDSNGNQVSEDLMKKGVIVRPLGDYNLNNFIRVTIGTEEENIKFIKAFKEVLSKS